MASALLQDFLKQESRKFQKEKKGPRSIQNQCVANFSGKLLCYLGTNISFS